MTHNEKQQPQINIYAEAGSLVVIGYGQFDPQACPKPAGIKKDDRYLLPQIPVEPIDEPVGAWPLGLN